MAGFPSSQLDRYLRQLVQDLNVTVAIVDQFERPDILDGSSEMKFDRKVSRIVTPGTLVDESFIDWERNNFLAAVGVPDSALARAGTGLLAPETPIGIAWINLGLGSFYVQTSTLAELATDLARISPAEVVIDKKLQDRATTTDTGLVDGLTGHYTRFEAFPARTQMHQYLTMFDEPSTAQVRFQLEAGAGRDGFAAHERLAVLGVLKYVREHLPETDVKVVLPTRVRPAGLMKIDNRSRAALELTRALRDGGNSSTRGTLLAAVRRTVTESGARLLSEWVTEPLTDISAITARQDVVQAMLSDPGRQRRLEAVLAGLGDPLRILQKLGLGKGGVGARDLLVIAQDLELMQQVRDVILGSLNENDSALNELVEGIDACKTLRMGILSKLNEDILYSAPDQTVYDEGTEVIPIPVAVAEVKPEWVVKPTSSTALKTLHANLEKSIQAQTELIETLRAKYLGFKLELKWSPGLGYHGHLTGKLSDLKDDENLFAQTLTRHKKTLSFRIPEWSRLGEDTEMIRAQIRVEERKVLTRLCKKVFQMKHQIRKNCSIIDQLDVLNSFANLARERNLVRPIITDQQETVIREGRHLAVEAGLARRASSFVANDCELTTDCNVWVITGPNMGGKSTFLRQVALISVLGQMGCYVPADYARLGVVDQIFCRVGAGDDLYRDQSTFMVEMLETTSILRHATPRSLAILDEVGRGTSSRDGLSIAYATLAHLCTVNRCRTLFATHFGLELQHLLETIGQEQSKEQLGDGSQNKFSIGYYCTDIEFFDEEITTTTDQTIDSEEHLAPGKSLTRSFAFSHRLRQGVSSDSHGLRIAVMAGFPEHAVTMAQSAMRQLGPSGVISHIS